MGRMTYPGQPVFPSALNVGCIQWLSGRGGWSLYISTSKTRNLHFTLQKVSELYLPVGSESINADKHG